MEDTTIKISKKHSQMIDFLVVKFKYNSKKRLLEEMIETYSRFSNPPSEFYNSLDSQLYRIEEKIEKTKKEIREIKSLLVIPKA